MKEFKDKNDSTLKALGQQLINAGVDVSKWGTGEAKTLSHLMKEIQDGEAVLTTDKDGKILRKVEASGAEVYYNSPDGKKYHLVEAKQIFKDGRERIRNFPWSIGEKMKPGEDPRQVIIRGMNEELGISGDVSVEEAGEYKPRESDRAQSYPGLRTEYVSHRFIITLGSEQYKPEGYSEVQEDKTTYFLWKEIK